MVISSFVFETGIFVYLLKMPYSVREMVTVCTDGYVIYINSEQSADCQIASLKHALWHIRNNDFEKFDVGEIENEAHKKVVV